MTYSYFILKIIEFRKEARIKNKYEKDGIRCKNTVFIIHRFRKIFPHKKNLIYIFIKICSKKMIYTGFKSYFYL